MIVLLVLVTMGIPGRVEAHDGHPVKGLFDWRWYHEATRDSTEWLTLSTHRHYGDTSYATVWGNTITNSISAWNSTSSAVILDEVTTPSDYHDVHIAISDGDGFEHWGDFWPTWGLVGIAYNLDISKNICLSAGDCTYYYYSLVIVDETQFFFWNDATDRKAALVHELGHALTLTHEPNVDSQYDGDCGNTVPGSVMDYDCVADEANYNSPTDWDACGLNHAYYHETWGYAGCDS